MWHISDATKNHVQKVPIFHSDQISLTLVFVSFLEKAPCRPGIGVSVTQRLQVFKPIKWYADSQTTSVIPTLHCFYLHNCFSVTRQKSRLKTKRWIQSNQISSLQEPNLCQYDFHFLKSSKMWYNFQTLFACIARYCRSVNCSQMKLLNQL